MFTANSLDSSRRIIKCSTTTADQLTAEVPHQLEEQRQSFTKGDDGHVDPDAQLAADVGDQLRQFIVGDLLRHNHVVVGEVDVDAGEIVLRVLPVGTTEVVLVLLKDAFFTFLT